MPQFARITVRRILIALILILVVIAVGLTAFLALGPPTERESSTSVQLGNGWGGRQRVRIRYGDGERQFVDLYLPDRERVWLAFVMHGGGFRGAQPQGQAPRSWLIPS